MRHPSRVGVDRQQGFWHWDAVEQSISRTTPEGKQLTLDVNDDISELDVDRERGIVILDKSRSSVRVLGWNGQISSVFRLPYTAGSVVWMDGDQIAVAPQTAPFLVEIWSTGRKMRLRQLEPVPAIEKPAAGSVALRTTLLRYDGSRTQLFALDAFEGRLVVFNADGRVSRRATISHPDLEANRAFLKQLDLKALQKRESSMPTFSNYARFSVASDGSVWVGERTGDSATVTVARISPSGAISRRKLRIPECNSVRFELWQGQLVFFRDPASTLPKCVAVSKERLK
ncbi:MAG TPA: hypothetical protein VE010_18190 [Thermoanaerobaculia bacterium]|nr:hypothetical protein [Thermoanaerobaculia bacterium]